MTAVAGSSTQSTSSYPEINFDDEDDERYDNDENSIYDSESEEDLDNIGEYYFETGRLAYKTNTDYKNVIESMVVLKAMRAQAIKDKQRLLECQKLAEANPFEFIEKLKKKEDLGIPRPQKLPQIPPIDWNKYDISGGHNTEFGRRQLNLIAAEYSARKRKARSYNDDNSESSFNKLWTAEEQKKLEKLLIEYPPEEVEMRRWEKISAALETRTATQVASRVQKYFMKLTRAGIPVPGKPPNCAKLKRKDPPSQEDPSNMDSSDHVVKKSSNGEVSDEDDISPDLRATNEYKELLLVKKILREKERKKNQPS